MSKLEEQVVGEFRAAWAVQAVEIRRRIEREASFQAANGRSRSGALLEGYARIYGDALEEAKQLLLTRTGLLPKRRLRWSRDRIASRLTECGVRELGALASEYNSELARSAANMGLASLAPTLDIKVEAVSGTLRPEINRALEPTQTQVPMPWYQRPVGIVLLGILVAIIVAIGSRMVAR